MASTKLLLGFLSDKKDMFYTKQSNGIFYTIGPNLINA